jgi:tetratricopeptide (TPR) repeat protein
MAEKHQHTVQHLRAKIDANSNDFRDYRKLGSLLFRLGQYQECPTLFEKAKNLSRKNLDKAKICVDLGWTAFWSEKYKQSRQLAEEALAFLATEKETPEVFAWRGAAQNIEVHCEWVKDRDAGEWFLESDKAKQTAHLALSYLGQVPFDCVHFEEKATAFYDAANIHSLLGNTDECLEWAQLCLKISQDNWERAACLTIIAETLRGVDRLLEAQVAIDEALGYAEEWRCLLPKLWLEKGLVQRLMNRPIEARQSFGQGLLLIESAFSDPRFRLIKTELYANLGAACYEIGDIRGATEAFSTVLMDLPQTDPYYRTGKVWLGRCLESSGDAEGARTCFVEALNLDLDHESKLTALEGLARLTCTEGKYDKAAEMFEQLALLLEKTDPRWINAKLWVAYCNEGLGNARRARDDYEVVLASEQSAEIQLRRASEGLQRLNGPNAPQYH